MSKIEVLSIVDNPDGSANINFDMDSESIRLFASIGIKKVIMDSVQNSLKENMTEKNIKTFYNEKDGWVYSVNGVWELGLYETEECCFKASEKPLEELELIWENCLNENRIITLKDLVDN